MKTVLTLVVLTFLTLQLEAAEVMIEACASATVTSQTAPGVMNGFAEECINLSEIAEAIPPLTSEGHSKSGTISFAFGGCNTSGADVNYTLEQKWRYSITKTADEEEKAEASITYSLGPVTVTEGTGSFTEEFSGTIENNVCVDGIVQLAASASVATAPGFSLFISDKYGMNGLFVDPASDGNGFNFAVHEHGLTIFYYGHTATGERLWLISGLLKSELQFFKPYELEMFEVVGGMFGSSAPGENPWGTLSFSIFDCDTVHASLAGNDGNATFGLERLAGEHGRSCL